MHTMLAGHLKFLGVYPTPKINVPGYIAIPDTNTNPTPFEVAPSVE